MADGHYIGRVVVAAADPTASAADFVPLDDSSSSPAEDTLGNDHGGDDSASDVSMMAESDDEDEVALSTSQLQPVQRGPPAAAPEPQLTTDKPTENAPRKRKPLAGDSDGEDSPRPMDNSKKVKLEQPEGVSRGGDKRSADRSTLPAEIWHHIFTFCPPRSLGRLLLVNRLFNVYLDPTSQIRCNRPRPLSTSALPLSDPNAIWQNSRRRFWPSMPSPLQHQTELHMWQLSCSTSCQHCGKQGLPEQNSSLQHGPGKDGVAIIWSFATRSCSVCFLKKTIKEIDILLSSSIPSALMAALPFVFMTTDFQVISPTAMERGQFPLNTSFTKLFWSLHLEELKQEFFSVKAMGPATVEEWLKGLEGRGAERRTDASRWEKWAITNDGLKQMKDVLYPGYRPPAHTDGAGPDRPVTITGLASTGRISDLDSANSSSRAPSPSVASSQQDGLTPGPFRRSSTGTASLAPGKHERTKEEVVEMKAARKSEIERRALGLDPPLPANILAHIPSFQASLQIISPMDDQAWELLKPRLLAQRADAEQRENESAARSKRELDEKRTQTAAIKEARDAEDADWDEVQAPVRARIAGFADEIIRDGWDNGDKVGRDNCSKFAVDVLTYIRKRFYAEVAKDASSARAAGKSPIVDLPQGPFTQKLTLENMKWIFDVKVKPHTERHRKEIFLCNGCDVTIRYYGFEGVIQHFAAKHTNALSSGNVVVHWRAEWPEHPPFTSEQKTAKSVYHQSQPPTPAYIGYQAGPSQTYQPAPGGTAPVYAPPAWNESYTTVSQAPYPSANTGYIPPQSYTTPPGPLPDSYQPYTTAQAHSQGYAGPPPPAAAGQYNYNYGAYQSNSHVGYQIPQAAPFTNQYRSQLEEMARMARELWNATSNMKDTLSIVRVQVVIHHIAKRFHAKFGTTLPLSTFIEGLSNHKDMRPVRNVNGLICRVCHQSIGGYVPSEDERKSYSLPQLTAHFQTKHVDPFIHMDQYGQPPEWTINMVLLPEPAAVSNLRAVVGMDGQKYHLVNEAVPHLLGTENTPQAIDLAVSGWNDHNGYHHVYQQTPAENQMPSYGQPPSDEAIHDGGTRQYQSASGPYPQHSIQSTAAFSYTDISAANAHSIPLDPSAAAYATSHGLGNDADGPSSQGFRQSREQNYRHSKKNKKKGGNSRDNGDAEARKRTEEEEKMAEEEAERETDVIRAMWAADRANAARKSALPEGDAAEKQNTTEKAASSLKQNSKPNTPKPNTPQQRHRFQSRPPRGSPRRVEETSPVDAAEPQFNQGPIARRDAPYQGHQLSNVIYMDSESDETQRADRRTPPSYRRSDSRLQRPRSNSPVYMDHNIPPPAQSYRQQNEPASQSIPPPPTDDYRYERPPLPREDFGPRGYDPPPLIEYEVIEYRDSDGTIWVEERPLRRIPDSETERYYGQALPPGPASYERGGPLAPTPYRRDQPPAPYLPVSEPYRPPYERSYSRAPQAAPTYDSRYPADPPPLRRNEPPPPPPLSRNEPDYYEEYDPRFPAAPPSLTNTSTRTSRYR